MVALADRIAELRALGYNAVLAEAKVVHDVILRAIERGGFKMNGTIKGGVVMSAITKDIRRATLDMDIDFIHHPIGETGVRRFVARLARAMPEISIAIRGEIVDLRHEDYRGKRVYLAVRDSSIKRWIRTKMDIGIHTHENIKQVEVVFEDASGNTIANLQANSIEQIFSEKLLSLLRHGVVSNRPKDVYDLCYLSGKISMRKLRSCVKELVYDNARCRANNADDIIRMLDVIFTSRPFLRRLNNAKANWMSIEPTIAIRSIQDVVGRL